MENSNRNHKADDRSNGMMPRDSHENSRVEASGNTATGGENGTEKENKPLPKIHPNLHSHGRYKMFSNRSSDDDIPKTSTGI